MVVVGKESGEIFVKYENNEHHIVVGKSRINDIYVTKDGRMMAVGGDDKILRIYDRNEYFSLFFEVKFNG